MQEKKEASKSLYVPSLKFNKFTKDRVDRVRRVNDRSSREKSPKWRTSKHDYTTTNVKKTSDSWFKACIYSHGITIQCRERKKKTVSKATCLQGSSHSQFTLLRVELMMTEYMTRIFITLNLHLHLKHSYHLSTRRRNFFPNLIVTDIVIRATMFLLSS